MYKGILRNFFIKREQKTVTEIKCFLSCISIPKLCEDKATLFDGNLTG